MDYTYDSPLILYRHPDAFDMSDADDPLYVVYRDYLVTIAGHRVDVPAGMLTDLASVPWAARWALGRVGRHLEAAVVHDYMYGKNDSWWDRKTADKAFLAGMLKARVNKVKAHLAYRAVRLFGRKSYTKGNEFVNIRNLGG